MSKNLSAVSVLIIFEMQSFEIMLTYSSKINAENSLLAHIHFRSLFILGHNKSLNTKKKLYDSFCEPI